MFRKITKRLSLWMKPKQQSTLNQKKKNKKSGLEQIADNYAASQKEEKKLL